MWVWDMWFVVSVRHVSCCCLTWVLWDMWSAVLWVWDLRLVWEWAMWFDVSVRPWFVVSVRHVTLCECETCDLLWVWDMCFVVSEQYVTCCGCEYCDLLCIARNEICCECQTRELLWVHDTWLWDMCTVVSVDMWFDVSVLLLFLLGSTLLVFHGIPLCHYLYRFASMGTTFHLIHIDLSLPYIHAYE